MLDDLRRGEGEFDFPEPEEDESSFDFDDPDDSSAGRQFLGMSPVERMFISIFFFMNVTVLGLALLLATNRI